MPDRLRPDDGDGLREFADRCRRVAVTARRFIPAETPEGAALLTDVAAKADALQAAANAAAEYADPGGGEDVDG